MNLRKDHYRAVPLCRFLRMRQLADAPVHPRSRAVTARCGTCTLSFREPKCVNAMPSMCDVRRREVQAKQTTSNGGSLGSRVDEDRSKAR